MRNPCLKSRFEAVRDVSHFPNLVQTVSRPASHTGCYTHSQKEAEK